MDNAAIISEGRRGNREALGTLYSRFAPRMLALIRKYVNDPDDAKDILHDGFLIALTRLDSLRNPDQFEYWLASIMRNLSLKFLKSRDLIRVVEELPDSEDHISVEEAMDLNTIESMIRTLPEGYRNVFRLAVLENKTHQEISELLGIAPKSSSSQLFRAKLRIRRLIDDYRKRNVLLSLLLIGSAAGWLYILEHEKSGLSLDCQLSSDLNGEKQDEHVFNQSPSPALTSYIKNTKTTNNISTGKSRSLPMRKSHSHSLTENIHPYGEENMDNGNLTDSLKREEDGSLSVVGNSDSITTGSPTHHVEEWTSLYEEPIPDKNPKGDNGWTFSLGITTGPGNTGKEGPDIAFSPSTPSTPPGGNEHPGGNPDVSFGGGDDDDYTDDKNEQTNDEPSYSPSLRGFGSPTPLKEQPHYNHQPISFSLTAQKRLNSWLGIETGLSYTCLHTTFEVSALTAEAYWHYLGIPLKANMTAFQAGRFRFYGSVGVHFYIPVYGMYKEARKEFLPAAPKQSFSSNPVISIGAGIGISFSVTDNIDLYIEPTTQRYFTHKVEIPNLWSDDPWGFIFPIGFRFNW